jgi:hypothetical protein
MGPIVKLTSTGTPRRKGRYKNCGIYGHWAKDCKKPKKERKEEAHHAQADVDHPSMLLATVNAVRVTSSRNGGARRVTSCISMRRRCIQ